MKIKITDFLEMNNKPKEFKYKNYIWRQPKGFNTHLNEDDIDFETYLASVQICDLGRLFTEVLNDEIEIIEETKEIEKIVINENGTIGFPNGEWTARNMDKAFAFKINELVKQVNYLLKVKGETNIEDIAEELERFVK